MTVDQALQHVHTLLQKYGPNPKVFLWNDHPQSAGVVGVRVAEVSFISDELRTTGIGSGASYMQSDPDGLMVCAAVERLLIELLFDDVDDSEVALQEDILHFCLTRRS